MLTHNTKISFHLLLLFNHHSIRLLFLFPLNSRMPNLITVYVNHSGPKPRDDGKDALIHYCRSVVSPFDILEKFRNRSESAATVIMHTIKPLLEKTFSFVVCDCPNPSDCKKLIVQYIRRKLYDLEKERMDMVQKLGILSKSPPPPKRKGDNHVDKYSRSLRAKRTVTKMKRIATPAGYVITEGQQIHLPTSFSTSYGPNNSFFFERFDSSFLKSHFTKLKTNIQRITSVKGKSIANPTRASLCMHKFWDINVGGKSQSDPVVSLLGGDVEAATSFQLQMQMILARYSFTSDRRLIIPSVVWNKKVNKKSPLQDPHLDWAKYHLFEDPRSRPLACIFPIDKAMFIQFWPSGPGPSCVVKLEVGDIFFFDSTIVHGGVVCDGSRVHCYIAEKISDTESVTKYFPDGSLQPFRTLYHTSMVLEK